MKEALRWVGEVSACELNEFDLRKTISEEFRLFFRQPSPAHRSLRDRDRPDVAPAADDGSFILSNCRGYESDEQLDDVAGVADCEMREAQAVVQDFQTTKSSAGTAGDRDSDYDYDLDYDLRTNPFDPSSSIFDELQDLPVVTALCRSSAEISPRPATVHNNFELELVEEIDRL
eukprot:TRINITY_DN2873_c0_g1_i4.p1 TRINITY_DN2873_c0_g1~~TRINITY_DN2873_c0_g1_i4.p1  ORF type:complete len:174 (-),score=15.52 TRINITY_DN2873_c0_g1_i4:441-962(-)